MQNLHLSAGYHLTLPEKLNGRILGCSADAVGDRLFVITSKGVLTFDRTTFKVVAECSQEFENVVAFRYNEESSASAVLITADGSFYLIRVASNDTIQVEQAAKLDEGVAAAAWSPDGDVCAIITLASPPGLMLISSKLDTIVEKTLVTDEQPEATAVSVGWGKKETQFHASEGKGAAFASPQHPTPAFSFDDRKFRISWRADGHYFVVHFVNSSTGCRDFRVYNRSCSLYSVMEPLPGIGQASVWRPYSIGGLIASSQQILNPSTSKSTNKIVFFEKNGLRHGDFTLPFDSQQIKVTELMCSPDAKLLYVICEDISATNNNNEHQTPSNSGDNAYVFVYATSNYHWYIKKALTFPKAALGRMWVDVADKPGRVYLAVDGHQQQTSHQQLRVYEWDWRVDRDVKNNCLGVIDGDSFLLTPFKLCTPPPPMSHVRSTLSAANSTSGYSAISAFSFCTSSKATCRQSNGNANGNGDNNNRIVRYAVVSANGDGVLNEYDYSRLENEPAARLTFKLDLAAAASTAGTDDTFRHLNVFNCPGGRVLALYVTSSATTNTCSSIVHLMLWQTCEQQKQLKLVNSRQVEVKEGTVVSSWPDPDGKFCLLQLHDGRLLKVLLPVVDDGINELKSSDELTIKPFSCPDAFPRRCLQVLACRLPSSGDDNDDDSNCVAVGLCAPNVGGPLYFGQHQLSACAISVAIDERFLVFVTTEHRAYFVPLSAALSFKKNIGAFVSWFIDVTSGPKTPLQALLTRPVERGAIVVGVDTLGDGSIVLEMPRGNIEKIHPRPLLLEAVNRNILEKMAYRKAFTTSLKHRISLNLLYDLNPEQFSANVSEFCKQLATADNLNLFILELIDDDVVETLYPLMKPLSVDNKKKITTARQQNNNDNNKQARLTTSAGSSKVDRVCDLLMATLKNLNEVGLYLATLTCYAKKTRPDLEGAVTYLKALAEKSKRHQMLDDGLKHLARLADVNDLYDIALGTYDLDLALTVAERTQKDPREYRSELTDFSQMQPLAYRRYRIDRKIGRHENAVRNLVDAGEVYFDELLNFVVVEKPKLLLTAAKLAELSPNYSLTRKRDLWIAYVERMSSERRYLEGGLCALRNELLDEAFSYLSRAHSWELTTAVASQLGAGSEEAFRDAAEVATESNDFSAAGQLYERFLNDHEMALESYLSGNDFINAYQLLSIKMGKSPVEIRKVIAPHLQQFMQQLLSSFGESIAELDEFANRLAAIDSEPVNRFGGGVSAFPYGDAELNDDLESVAPSTAASTVRTTTSQSSRYSGRSSSAKSSKSSRWRLKVGSPTERFAIMERLIAYAKDRLPIWRKQVEDASLLSVLVLDASELWSSSSSSQSSNDVKLLQDELRSAVSALRKAVEMAWSSNFIEALAQQQNEQEGGASSNLLDERIRYSPMCYVFSEEAKIISSTSSSSISNIITRLL